MRKKEGRVKIQNIDNNSERENEYAEKERKKIIISFYEFKTKTDSRFFNRKNLTAAQKKRTYTRKIY